jgi:hypothetical protein
MMDLRDSPYVPGAGTRPYALVGREEIIQDFDGTLERLGAWAGCNRTGDHGITRKREDGSAPVVAKRLGRFPRTIPDPFVLRLQDVRAVLRTAKASIR